MSILESVVQGLGVEINKQFQVYGQEGNHVAAAVFKLDRDGCQKALVQRMRFTRGGQIQIMYTVYCPDCQAHGPLVESEDAAADGWNE